ncbi:MAG: PaaI family thioesterase [Actinomycetota bacterium]|nr:PaaI family thioesterase [Actinomycetota bacterium]
MDEKSGFRELVGIELSEAEEGRAVASMRPGDQHLNPGGTVHGGAISTLVDVAMAEALNTTLDEEAERPVTVEMKVNYMAPGRPGVIVAAAKVRKGGKRVTVVEAEVVQEDDEEVVALATGTYTVVG